MQTLHSSSQASQWLKSRVRGTLQSDSRQVQAGDGFIAWPGAAHDARRFAPAALEQGAAACLVEHQGAEDFDLRGETYAAYVGLKSEAGFIASEFFGHPSQALDVLAVTGTNGKTSTAWWLAQALGNLPEDQALPCGMIGTLGVGLPGQLEVTGLTTPDPLLLQKTLRHFVDTGMKACAIEASSIGIGEHRLDGTQVRVAIFTNFTQDHLDYHGDMAAYWSAKRQLFSWAGLRSAVVNIDDAQGILLAQELEESALDLWTVSRHTLARLSARNLAYEAQGMQFDVVEGGQSIRLHTAMMGDYNVSNLLGVIATLRSLGIALPAAVRACQGLTAVPGRMDCMGGDQAPLVVVDYAHTPDALENALSALRPVADARAGALWCVFGCGGDRDAGKRPAMGAIAMQGADLVIVTSDNPRTERPESIIAQILAGMSTQRAPRVLMDRAQAIAEAVTQATERDVVLIAGKGHESTQEIGGQKFEFSDKDHARLALLARSAALEAAP